MYSMESHYDGETGLIPAGLIGWRVRREGRKEA